MRYTIRKTVVYLIISMTAVILQFSPTSATEDTTMQRPQSAVMIPYFIGGVAAIDMDDFNQKLQPLGYRRIRDYAYDFAAGFHRMSGSIIRGGELRLTQWETRSVGGKTIQMRNLCVSTHFGFNALENNPIVDIFPFIGVGGGILELVLRRNAIPFDTLANSSTLYHQDLTQATILVSAGIELHYMIKNQNRPEMSKIIGLRIGFGFDPSQPDDWSSNAIEISDGPRLIMTGLNAGLFFAWSFKQRQ